MTPVTNPIQFPTLMESASPDTCSLLKTFRATEQSLSKSPPVSAAAKAGNSNINARNPVFIDCDYTLSPEFIITRGNARYRVIFNWLQQLTFVLTVIQT